MNKQPFITPNPEEFKLRVVWSVDLSTKMVAEFSTCKWLPRIGETLVLPVDEAGLPKSWRKFKVFDIVYDFQASTTKVLCSLIKSPTSTEVKSLISKVQQPKDNWDVWEKAMQATTTFESVGDDFGLEYQFSQLEQDAEDELEILKSQITQPKKE